ncbi:MAG: DUF1934 domain-containing protein [Lachnospiraceae bacterium]|nr:DUF1934 domain-containing protein [Lachnospiraceae bacterium]
MAGSWNLTYETATVSPGGDGSSETQREENIACSLSEESTGIRIAYEETDAAGNRTACMLAVCADAGGEYSKVLFERRGEISSSFVFCEGPAQPLQLETPYGRLNFEVETPELHVKKERQRIEVRIRYRLVDSIDEEHLLVFLVSGT